MWLLYVQLYWGTEQTRAFLSRWNQSAWTPN